MLVEGEKIKIFSRHLKDITKQLPEIVDIARKIPVNEFIIDGEAIRIDKDNMPLPFQILARRTMRKKDITKTKAILEQFLQQSMLKGNEGLMIKLQDSPYQAGKRQKLWLKLKPAKTIDCIILGKESKV